MTQTSLGRKLRLLRAERELSLRSAAHLCGVTKETLSALERGVREPHDPTLAKIAKGYGVPVEELLEEPVGAGKDKTPEAGPSDEEVSIFEVIHEAALRQARAEQQAINRTYESEGPQAADMSNISSAFHWLLRRRASEIAEAYVDLMQNFIQLERENEELRNRIRVHEDAVRQTREGAPQ